MKKLFVTSCVMLAASFLCAQNTSQLKDTIRTVFENEKMKVTEYVSTPGKDICGKGQHTHPAHLNILLTPADGIVTSKDGKSQKVSLPEGATFWSEADTHIAINNGKKPARLYIIEMKQ